MNNKTRYLVLTKSFELSYRASLSNLKKHEIQWASVSYADHFLFSLAIYFLSEADTSFRKLGYHSGGSCGLVFPIWWQYTFLFVVSSQTVNSWFNQNQAEFGISILTITFEMFSDGDCLLNKVIDIFWQIRSQTLGLEDSQNFVTSDEPNLGNTMWIPIM